MQMTATEPRPRTSSGSAKFDQIYVTHCLHGEGRFGQAGFNVQASSTEEPLLLRFARDYPAYELPWDLRQPGDLAEIAPCRLALVKIPGGRSALIHSVHLPEDKRGRANNFFSHVLVAPALNPRQALTTWASPEWVTHRNSATPLDLTPLAGLPSAGPLNDRAVTAFLQATASSEQGDSSLQLVPTRLSDDPEQRQELLRVVLRGCQIAIEAFPAARCRFYILAEPRLTALLLYAAARLLPDALGAKLTFSTYEHARRDLRSYKYAQVVGTIIADPTKGLDADLYTTRGYALDTFKHEYSTELAADASTEFDDWIQLAATGEWRTLDKVRQMLGANNTTLVSFPEARQAYQLSTRLTSGQAEAEELIALRQTPWGQSILDANGERVWELVREASRSNERVREAFADLLRQNLHDLERRAAEHLKEPGSMDWRSYWQTLAFVLKEDPRELWEVFERMLPGSPYPASLRLALLEELCQLQLPVIRYKLRGHALLRNCRQEDLELLVGSSLDRELVVWALCYALFGWETRPTAVAHLHAGDDPLLKTFWQQFQLLQNEDQRRAVLAPLFPPSEAGARFFSRSLGNHIQIKYETLVWLLDWLGALTNEWNNFWAEGDHLGQLLETLRRSGQGTGELWDRLCSRIDRELIVPGDPMQRVFLMELAAAKERPGPSLPEMTVQTIADWVLLREHFEKASAEDAADQQAVIDACNRRGLDPVDLLASYFVQYVLPCGLEKEVLDDFVGFYHRFCPSGGEFQDYSCRLLWWLRFLEACPEESTKALYQRYYLEQFVPHEFRWRLVEETYRAGKISSAVYESILKPTASLQLSEKARDSERDGLFLFQVAGVRPPNPNEQQSRTLAIWKRFYWLCPGIAGGILAFFLCQIYKAQMGKVAAFVLFVPAVFALAEAVASQALGMMLARFGHQGAGLSCLRKFIVWELLTGSMLGGSCGLIFGLLARFAGGSMPSALAVGSACVLALATASAIGLAMPLLLRRFQIEVLLSGGALARALAGIVALLLYFVVARFLLA